MEHQIVTGVIPNFGKKDLGEFIFAKIRDDSCLLVLHSFFVYTITKGQ